MPRKILLVRLSSIGDVLLTTPLLRVIRTRYPDARITFVTKTAFLPLLEHNPRIDELIGYDPIRPLRPLARHLARAGFTDQLDLHGSLRTRMLRWLVPGRWHGYPKHQAARSLLIRTKRNWYRDTRPVPERYFDAARDLALVPDGKPLEMFIGRESMDQATGLLRARGVGQSRALVALAPGAQHATKRWPLRHWQILAATLTAADTDVVVLGGPDEAGLGDDVAVAGGDRAISLAGRVGLGVSAALLKLARCAVSGDTGLMHLATAVSTPVVALFGPTVKPFGFFPYQARATVLERDLPCRPCSAIGGAVCPLGHHHCLTEITPDEVYDAIRRLPK